jgi:hypothetical protein
MILVGLCVLGCTATPQRVDDTPVISPAYRISDPECPYANVYVAVSTNGSKKDTKIAKRVRFAYSDFLVEHGFSIVGEPEEAYWSAFSMVRLSPRIDPSFAWTVYMMATHDLRGDDQTPRNFAQATDDENGELSGFMILREVRLLELETQARRAALDTAGALLPHASRMCKNWRLALQEVETPQTVEPVKEIVQVPREEDDLLEKQRRLLVEEMTRVRRDIARSQQRKRLMIEIEE